ncbi:hypothetical protein HCN51_19855 [Nonomuraea sp. FMUSA5-5]|uniref:Uncharacterized protein n=1 Tax=Nonomuraea composti TaxID=2720023 RepID=A0ABX1B5A1_9ACTN|nr:hypothetical protein [Nonomuraea sp. FMUSA5-5]NJP91687.1 hypothetical protein [Nonomuraea sp. FMUSA5-5]
MSFPDVAAEIRVAGHELAVKGVALAAVGEDLRVREKVCAEPARVELAAVAELTCEDLGVKPPELDDLLPKAEEEPACAPAPPVLEEEPVDEPVERFWSW